MTDTTAPPRDRSFEERKAEGTQVEWLMVDLLAAHGWTPFPTQIAWDAAGNNSPARAFGPDWEELWVPDIDAQSPAPLHHRAAFDTKSKEPLSSGEFGWDARSFSRAERWQERMRAPVVYAIRDRSIAPVPMGNRSGLDTLDPWIIASLHRLRMHKPWRMTNTFENEDGVRKEHTTYFWPREVFSPLSDLLDGGFNIAPVLLRPTRIFGMGLGRLF
ncbi:MAG TPA: hypothetical protein VEX11_02800 [Acetobacteraceae bacterium]|nr:hypothetical protein [Acetobacteraceae bacterium]